MFWMSVTDDVGEEGGVVGLLSIFVTLSCGHSQGISDIRYSRYSPGVIGLLGTAQLYSYFVSKGGGTRREKNRIKMIKMRLEPIPLFQ